MFHSKGISSFKNILDSAGFSGLWTNQTLYKSPDSFNTIFTLSLHDLFMQNWNEGVSILGYKDTRIQGYIFFISPGLLKAWGTNKITM